MELILKKITKCEISSFRRWGIYIDFAIFIGFLPYISLLFLSAPFISNSLTALALFTSSELYTATCKGVNPE